MDDAERLAESAALHRRARAFVRAFVDGVAMPEPFDALAVDLARFQAQHVEGYARLCRARGLDPRRFTRAADAPAVPTDAFKVARAFAFPEADERTFFLTSGTTVGARGRHSFRDIGTYDAGALAFGRWALSSDLPSKPVVLCLSPPPSELPESSLVHMMDLFRRELGAEGEGGFFFQGDAIDIVSLERQVLRAFAAHRSVLLLATSFALVRLLDALGGAPLRLPDGSRVMQTGGFKGKSREVGADALRRDLARTFSVSERAIVCEYGMTELSSQFYETTLRDRSASHGTYVEPPWARVVPVDPDTSAPVPEGEVGLARIEDLLNVDSAFAVLARDRVRRVPGGFELLGRAPGAPPRGCSLAIEEMLER
jgi:hypothetical protein